MVVPTNAVILDTFPANALPKYLDSISGTPVLEPSLLTDDGTTLKYNGQTVSGGSSGNISGSGTTGKVPKFTAAGAVGNSAIDDGVTTAGVVTSTEPVAAPYILPTVIYSVAGTALPAASTALKGARAVVSDATTPTYLGAYVGGGAVVAQVLCTGAGWVTC